MALRRAMLSVGMVPESFWGVMNDPHCLVWPTPTEARNVHPPGPDRLTFKSVVEAVAAELDSLVGGSLFGLSPARLTTRVAARTLGTPTLWEVKRFVRQALIDTEDSPVQRATMTPAVTPSSIPGKVLLDWSAPLQELLDTGVQPAWLELSVVFEREHADYAPFPIVGIFPPNVGSEVLDFSDILSPGTYVGQRGPIPPTIDRIARLEVTAVWGTPVTVNDRWVAVDNECITMPVTLYALQGIERPDIWLPMVLSDYPESACSGCFASVDVAWWKQRSENGIPFHSPLGSTRGRVEAWYKLQQLIAY